MGVLTVNSDMKTTLETALLSSYPGASVILDVDMEPEGTIINGFLIWSGYREHDHHYRQAGLTKILRQHLTAEERRRVHLLMTVTPDEYAAMREPQL